MIIGYSFGVAKSITPEMVRAFNIASKNVDLHYFGLISDEACQLWLGDDIPSYVDRYNKLRNLVNISNVLQQKGLDPLENLEYLRKRFPGCEIHVFHDDEWDYSLVKRFVKRFGNGDVHFVNYKEIINGVNINFALMSKAAMFHYMNTRITKGILDESYSFYVNDYKQYQDEIVDLIVKAFKGDDVIVRSSLYNEDVFSEDHIRHFPITDSKDKNSVVRAINKLIREYDELFGKAPAYSKILVQRRNTDVVQYGKIFSKELHKGRPYYYVKFFDNTNISDIDHKPKRTELYIARNLKPSEVEKPWDSLIAIIKEVESITNDQFIGLKWAMKSDGRYYINLVQHLSTKVLKNRSFDSDELFARLEDVQNEYVGTNSQNSYRAVNLCVKGLLSPSEFIRNRCYELEYSLFDEILAKSTYSNVYKTIGYCGSPYSLTRRIGNKAYASVSDATYTVIPVDLSESLKGKIHTYYKNLSDDYAEEYFKKVITTFSFDNMKDMNTTFGIYLSQEEKEKYCASLAVIASKFINEYFDSITELNEHSTETLELMKKAKEKLLTETDRNKKIDIFKDIILYDKAIMAYGYVYSTYADSLSRNILKSLKSDKDTAAYADDVLAHALNTDYDMTLDLNKLFTGRYPILDFVEKYGDIRMATFDVLSPFIKDLDLDFEEEVKPLPLPSDKRVPIPEEKLQALITKHHLEVDPITLGVFLSSALKQRSFFRYYFDKGSSIVLDATIHLGENLGLTLAQYRHLTLGDIFASQTVSNPSELSVLWNNAIESRENIFHMMGNLVLPDYITKKIDLSVMKFIRSENLVGELPVEDIVQLSPHIQIYPQYRTVFIDESFTNYSWVLAYNIVSLICYRGDENGDLANKCKVFKIPSAFETGRINFVKLGEKSLF